MAAPGKKSSMGKNPLVKDKSFTLAKKTKAFYGTTSGKKAVGGIDKLADRPKGKK